MGEAKGSLDRNYSRILKQYWIGMQLSVSRNSKFELMNGKDALHDGERCCSIVRPAVLK